jgi:hypothetical protein
MTKWELLKKLMDDGWNLDDLEREDGDAFDNGWNGGAMYMLETVCKILQDKDKN